MKQRSINTFFSKSNKSADPGDAKENIKGVQSPSKVVDAVEELPPKDVKRRRLQQASTSESAPTKEAIMEDLLDDVDAPSAPPASKDSAAAGEAAAPPSSRTPAKAALGVSKAQKEFASLFKQPPKAFAAAPATKKGAKTTKAEGSAKEPAGAAKVIADVPAKEAAIGGAKDGAAVKDAADDSAKGATKGATKDTANGAAEDAVKDAADEATKDATNDAAPANWKTSRGVSPRKSPKRSESPEKAPAAAAADGGAEALGSVSDDPIEFTDDDEQQADAGDGVKMKKKSGVKKSKPGSPTKKGAAVDGVGNGAIAAAAKHAGVDVEKLVDGRWQAGQPVPYEFLADTFEEIAQTTKRLEITHLLISCFRGILFTTPEDLLPAVYMCINRVAPQHEGVELGVGEGILIKALASATGRTESRIKEDLKVEGDLGTLAVKARSTQNTLFKQAPLTMRGVFKAFQEISTTSGTKSAKRKEGLIVKMLASSKGNETGYVMRSLQAKLRIGLAEQSVLTALAHAVKLHQADAKELKLGAEPLAGKLEQAAQVVKVCYSECPSYDVMIPALLAHGFDKLHEFCHFMPGVPIKPMLAKPTNGVDEVLEKFGTEQEFTCEYKYDGERAQVHVKEDGTVMIFSRNAEDNTSKYPDIVQGVKVALKPGVKSIVFDSEAVAWDREVKRILPFQVLSTRKRKDVAMSDIQVQVCIFAFDCLYLNGVSLLREPLTKRREAMYASLEEHEGKFMYATEKTSRDIEELAKFLDDAVEASTEGLIVKTLCDTYEPAKRSSHWLKLKKDYMDGVGDTFDVVPIGGFHGKGKRTGLYGAYLLSVYDPESETYQTISKLGTGFSDEVLQQLTDTMQPHIIKEPRRYYTFGETLEPDVWFDAAVVWEVKAADLSISPVHKAALDIVEPGKGISIRFPRLIRIRDDKKPEDATSAQQVADMYSQQASVKAQKKPVADAEEEDD